MRQPELVSNEMTNDNDREWSGLNGKRKINRNGKNPLAKHSISLKLNMIWAMHLSTERKRNLCDVLRSQCGLTVADRNIHSERWKIAFTTRYGDTAAARIIHSFFRARFIILLFYSLYYEIHAGVSLDSLLSANAMKNGREKCACCERGKKWCLLIHVWC